MNAGTRIKKAASVKKRFLFVHQNFPGQFLHVAQALVKQGHEVVALGIKGRAVAGVNFVRYEPRAPDRPSAISLAQDFEVKLVRGLACATAMETLKSQGFVPDIVVAHPGWGEALFCRDVWPGARLVIYAEFFYRTHGADYGFDREMFKDTPIARARLRLKNTIHLHAFEAADTIYAPTEWQRSQLPAAYRDRCEVMFDGIETSLAIPDPAARIGLKKAGIELAAGDEVITFVNRNLEPYRGFHVFMRALPEILARRPHAHCLIVGRDGVSYGSPPPGRGSWRAALLREMGDRLPPGRVHFLGSLPYRDYLKVLQVSACHVYMTYPFVLSWSCLEAMSVGCPLVASSTGPVTEVVRDGENGLLFDFFDGVGLVDKAVALLEDRALGERLGRQARADMVERYDLRRICLPGQLKVIEG